MLIKPSVVLGCVLATNIAIADSSVEFSGFGTVTAVASSSDRYGFRPDISYDNGAMDGDIDFLGNSLVGGQLDYQLSDRLSLTGQAVLRDRVDNDVDSVVSQTFFKYNLNPALNFRLGRVPIDLFSLTEFRDIGYAYPWAAAPIEVYGLVPNRALDGADVSYTVRLKNSALTTKLHGGISQSVSTIKGQTVEFKLEDIVGISLDWGDIDWMIKLRHTQAEFAENPKSITAFIDSISQVSSQIWPNVDNFLDGYSVVDKKIRYSSIGASYTLESWTLSSEYSCVNSDLAIVKHVESGYLSLTYRTGDLSIFTVFGLVDSDVYVFDETITVPPEFFPGYDEFVGGLTTAMNSFASNQTSVSLGARYELTDSVALKLQWTNSDIDKWGGALWHSSTAESQPETINTLLFGVSFIF